MVDAQEQIGTYHRPFFSPMHIQNAAFFSRMSYAIEQADPATLGNNPQIEHRAHVNGAVMASVAFLEATINELFVDVAEDFDFQNHLCPEARRALADAWSGTCWSDPIDKKKPILEKFGIFLQLACGTTLGRGTSTYQDVDALIKRRNDLVHYKPRRRRIQPPEPPTDKDRV